MNGNVNTAQTSQSEIERLKSDVFLQITSELIKLLLPYGIQYREAVRLLGPAFSSAIAKELIDDNQKPTVSRVAIRSGVNRHKAKEWMTDNALRVNGDIELGVHARILKEWHDNPDFLDSAGEPMLLTKSGPGKSFFDLVDSCRFTTDIYPGTVLKDLLHHGSMIKKGQWLKVENRHFVTKKQSFESLKFSLISTTTVLKTNIYNCNEKAETDVGRINKLAHADIPASQVAEIEELIRVEANAFLTVMSKKLESFCVGLGENEPKVRLGVGVYGLNNEDDTPD